ncbi:hypothetical protein [Mucilaginibacter sp.]|uniref:toxin-antitoxin system YwqK family antitoxin n=1 Tax=Mucilaginibacter sp. TaxID=1882438 RepID=UPI00262F8DA7|nr:hypothetical protein [Mucilaginibacter sp.]MDB4918950.1 Gram-negative bacterial tonB protein [Mucilaginibacter sp.]
MKKYTQMKFCCLIALSLLIVVNCTAQIHKVYVDSKGNFDVEWHKAVSYMLIRKNADSDYSAQKYSMRDTILMRGNYKDSLLTIPNGKFVFYKKETIPDNLKGAVRADTNNYVSEVSYFLNGNKTGMWVEFNKKNVKRCSYIYKNNKLNGNYRRYHKYISDYVLEEGEYIDDKKDGEWNFYGYDTIKTPLVTQLYKNGKLLKQIAHIKLACFQGDLNKYLRKSLKIPDTLRAWSVETEIIIAQNGEVKDPKLIRSSLPDRINNILLPALATIPRFIPEFHDGNPQEVKYKLLFSREENKYSLAILYRISLAKEVGNGMSIEDHNGLVEEHSVWPSDPDPKNN